LNLTIGYGRVPWIALALCISFGIYGLLRKKSGTAAIPGLFLETVMLTPLALIYLTVLHSNGTLIFGPNQMVLSLILVSAGIVTGLPLVWFGQAARYLRLTTLGFLQYLAPTGSLFIGVFLYHEDFSRAHAVTFGLIWIALAIFTWEAVMRWRSTRSERITAAAVAGSAI
jgi:chloramphenicol-sensitive protein RarD